MSEVAAKRCSAKKLSSKFRKTHRETPALQSLSNKVIDLQAVRLAPATLFKKETLTQVFFSEFCEILKKIFLTEHLRMVAPCIYL